MLLTLALLAACGEQPAAGGRDGIPHAGGADDLVLRIDVGGGFVPREFTLQQVPPLSLFGDGTVVTEGAQIEIYPGPALPPLVETHLTEEGIQAILEAAREAGLRGPDRSFKLAAIADAPTTTFTVVAGGEKHVTSVYALAELPARAPGMSDEELAARRALAELQGKLTNPRSWLPDGSVGEERAFAFPALRVYAGPYVPDPELEQPDMAWPLEPSLATFGVPVPDLPDTRCGVVSGEDLGILMPAIRRANELTPWTSGGERFRLLLRPLLPDEHGC